MVLKNEIWPVRMERITDSSAAEVMKLMMLKSEIFSPLSGLSWYCLCCVWSVLMVDSCLLLRCFYRSAERELLNHPGFSVLPVAAGCKLRADSNGSCNDYAMTIGSSQPKPFELCIGNWPWKKKKAAICKSETLKKSWFKNVKKSFPCQSTS